MLFPGGLVLLFSFSIITAQDEIWSVGRIDFIGNNHFSDEKLIEQMTLKPPALFRKTKYFFSKLSDDIESIKRFYKLNGFRLTKVNIDRIYRNRQYRVVEIQIQIDEGIQTLIDTIIFRNNQKYSYDSLLKMLPFAINQPFDSIAIVNGSQIIEENLKSIGYLFSEVLYEININDTQSQADIVYNIRAGPLVKIGRIEIQGLLNIKHKVINRELHLESGQTLSSSVISRNTSLLYNTGLLYMVSIVPADTPANLADIETLTVPIRVKVSESDFFELFSGGGYSTEDGLYGNISASYRNLFGLGHQISLITRASFDILSAELSYIYPQILGLSLYSDITGYVQKLEEPTFSGAFGGVIIGLNKTQRKFSHYRTYLKVERVSWIEDQQTIDTLTDISPENSFILGASITLDTRKSVFNPGRGFFANINADLSGFGIIPWSSNFYKISADLRSYSPFFNRFSFSSAIYGGYIHGFSGDQTPAQERFFFGSENIRLIRGYSESELTLYDAERNAIGGNFAMVITPVEIIFPIYNFIRGAVFIEGGNVWPEIRLFSFRDFFWSTGPGLRLTTPVGPIRLDYGIKLDGRLPLDGRFSLGIGLPF